MEQDLRGGAPDGDRTRFADEWDGMVVAAYGFERSYYQGRSCYLPDQLTLVEALRRTSVVGLCPFFGLQFVGVGVTSGRDRRTAERAPVAIRTGETEYDIHVGYIGCEECPRVARTPDPVDAAERFAALVEDRWRYRDGRPTPMRDSPWTLPERWRGPAALDLA